MEQNKLDWNNKLTNEQFKKEYREEWLNNYYNFLESWPEVTIDFESFYNIITVEAYEKSISEKDFIDRIMKCFGLIIGKYKGRDVKLKVKNIEDKSLLN